MRGINDLPKDKYGNYSAMTNGDIKKLPPFSKTHENFGLSAAILASEKARSFYPQAKYFYDRMIFGLGGKREVKKLKKMYAPENNNCINKPEKVTQDVRLDLSRNLPTECELDTETIGMVGRSQTTSMKTSKYYARRQRRTKYDRVRRSRRHWER